MMVRHRVSELRSSTYYGEPFGSVLKVARGARQLRSRKLDRVRVAPFPSFPSVHHLSDPVCRPCLPSARGPSMQRKTFLDRIGIIPLLVLCSGRVLWASWQPKDVPGLHYPRTARFARL